MRIDKFSSFQVNKKLMAKVPKDAIVLHCLPAHRTEEITDDLLESSQSVVFDQTEKKIYAQAYMRTVLADIRLYV